LWDILLQDQYFSSIRHRKNGLDLSLFFFSAPSPVPEIDTSGILKVTDSDIMALATVKPRFERENHLGFKSNFYQLYSKPDCEFFYETRSKNFTLSIMNEPLSFLKLGFLNKWKNKKLDPATSSITVASYAEMLVWFELLWKKDKKEHSFEPSLRVEHHLAAQKKGSLISPKLQYWINNNFLIYSQVHILMGHALSYYGNWRSLDSINMGLKFLW